MRLCTEPYRSPTHKNSNKLFMHLTNYAINKARRERARAGGSASEGGADSRCTVAQARESQS